MNSTYFETLWRVEFNEEKQKFHLELLHKKNYMPNTNGWRTIIPQASDFEFHIFEAFVNRKKINLLTVTYLKECLQELNGFKKNLSEYKIELTRS